MLEKDDKKKIFSITISFLFILFSFSSIFIVTLNFNNDTTVDGQEGLTCFPAGTKITMADGSYKNIEDVVVGDYVLSFNIENDRCESQIVYGLERPIRNGVYDVNEGMISPTCDHPIYTLKSDGRVGWGAMDAVYSKTMHGFDFEVSQIEVGDYFLDIDGNWVLIESIDFRSAPIRVYTISVAYTHTFYANDFLVHNCGGGDSTAPNILGYSSESCSWTDTFPQITVACGDNVGLAGYEYSFTTNAFVTPERYDYNGVLSGSPDSFETPEASPAGGSGEYYLHVKIEDSSRNTATDSTGPFRFDVTDPTNSAEPESESLDGSNVNEEASIDVSVDDSHSGPDRYMYSWTTSTAEPEEFDEMGVIADGKCEIGPKTSHGTWYLHVKTTDVAANEDYDYYGPFVVNAAPTGDFTGGDQTIDVGGSVSLSDSSSDDDGITNYSWDLNNDGNYEYYTENVSYTFRHPYEYTVALKLTDSDGAETTVTKTISVKDTHDFVAGKNFFTWRKNASFSASRLANKIGLSEGDSIIKFNETKGVNDWDDAWVMGAFSADFAINRYDVVLIDLNNPISDVDFGVGDTLDTKVNTTLSYVDSGSSNYGYNAVPWLKEESIRASDLATEISLPDYYTVNVFNETSQTYSSYLKLPGNPTAGVDGLDPWIECGQVFIVKVPSGQDITFDTSKIDSVRSKLVDDNTVPSS